MTAPTGRLPVSKPPSAPSARRTSAFPPSLAAVPPVQPAPGSGRRPSTLASTLFAAGTPPGAGGINPWCTCACEFCLSGLHRKCRQTPKCGGAAKIISRSEAVRAAVVTLPGRVAAPVPSDSVVYRSDPATESPDRPGPRPGLNPAVREPVRERASAFHVEQARAHALRWALLGLALELAAALNLLLVELGVLAVVAWALTWWRALG